MSQSNLDSRRHAFRPNLADTSLRGRVNATNFIDGHAAQLIATAPVLKEPSANAMMISQGMAGESVQVFETADDWSWVQLQRDGYVGYVPTTAIARSITFATHVVTAPTALLFSAPDLKSRPRGRCFLNEEISLQGSSGPYVQHGNGGYLHEQTVAPLGTTVSDFVSVAERFIGATYLWGGKTADGIDCSGLVQVALHATGQICPRDSDMQMNELGTSVGTDTSTENLRRGDLVFWDGHVGIMQNSTTLLHANAWHMETAHEPLSTAVSRISADGKPVLDIRRL